MPRKATKSASASASRSTSKRPAPDVPARQSKRARATARKSYVEPESDSDSDGNKPKTAAALDDDDDDVVASDYEEHSDKEPSSESEHDETASEDDLEGKRATPRGRVTKSLAIHKKASDEKELWKPGAKLAPGTQLIIKKPKARDAGDTPYLDHTIHPNTMLFLKDLTANNDRQWLKLHDPDFRVSFQDFTTFAEKVSEKIIEADETIPELPVKDVIYRIYRDIRFSKDPTPYKTYFSAAWSRTGRKGPYAHYYIQVQPKGGSFVGGGFWQPDASTLAKLRRDIDRKPHKIKAVLTDSGIRGAFLGGVKDDKKKAVRAFTGLSMNQSNALKRNPKGYDHDHKDIELMRLRNFTMGRKLADDEIVGPGGLERVGELIASLVPFITYLNSVAMPDDDTSDSSDDEGSDAEPDDDSNAAEDDEA
ncbi:hypothetical protein BKA58DRAFT_384758 [Alternaria rosae]|uniref:uncharacterized protein n=1 Tax=Alternaria rosae TaxID=1187941 RepID=UPI001E8CFC3B|nr:uncharacterized protein BKA58DRAFT_384758 [Alternaria rosae]KAH6870293.1 hypothetical protein BKA58DRAFT_384758 [Alternaria rosae]